MKARYHAGTIAQWFINRAYMDVDNGGEMMTHLKLQKLLYYAQGCYSAMKGKALFDDKIYAWQHGPVVPAVYSVYKEYGANPIKDTAPVEIDEDTEAVLEQVYQVFGQFSALKLREMTHNETPWKTTENGKEIPTKVITEFFKQNYITQADDGN